MSEGISIEVNPVYETLTILDTGEVLSIVQPEVSIVTVGMIGPVGPAGAGAVTIRNFSWGDASPAVLITVPLNKRIYRVRLFVEIVFNGIGAALSVGSAGSPDELMTINENAPSSEGTYETYPDKRYLVDTPVYLTITPGAGASTGSGQIHLEIEP